MANNREILINDCMQFITDLLTSGTPIDPNFMLGVLSLQKKDDLAPEHFSKCDPSVMHHAYAIVFCRTFDILVNDYISPGHDEEYHQVSEKMLRPFVTDDAPGCIWNLYGFTRPAFLLPYITVALRKGYDISNINVYTALTNRKCKQEDMSLIKDYRLYMLMRAHHKGVSRQADRIAALMLAGYQNEAQAVHWLCIAAKEEPDNTYYMSRAKELMSGLNYVDKIMKFQRDITEDPAAKWKFDDNDDMYKEICEYLDKTYGPADEHIKLQQAEDAATKEPAEKPAEASSKNDNAERKPELSEELMSIIQALSHEERATLLKSVLKSIA